jgi:UDP-N-acetylmuramoyl-tripeptide--D-alanyl-D-alanine ligase
MFNALTDKFKTYVRTKVEGYVQQYFAAHPEVKLIVVAGSVGKTSTKMALATMLGQRYRVRVHEGNHNTELSAPVAILGVPYPEDIKSISQWRKVFRAMQLRIAQPPDVDVIIQELGADRPGDIAQFSRYLRPDIAVITSVTAEHMEYFKTMDAVAQEELSTANFSKYALINRDDIEGKYANYLTNPNVQTYGTSSAAEYHFQSQSFTPEQGHQGLFTALEFPQSLVATVKVLGAHNLRPAVAAATVGIKLGLTPTEVANGLAKITPVAGRMRLLQGLRDSTIIDDTYNSSPLAAENAINTFLGIEAPQRIAILGSMNELGAIAAEEHAKLGKMFHPDTVDWVITVGEDANKYLATAAHANGCQVKSFLSSVDAGAFAHSVLKPGALVLAKGSQGNIFVEEAVKVLLRHPEDNRLLVRQSPAWMAHKEEFFAQFTEAK